MRRERANEQDLRPCDLSMSAVYVPFEVMRCGRADDEAQIKTRNARAVIALLIPFHR